MESESNKQKRETLENLSVLLQNAPIYPRHWAKLTGMENK